MRKLRLTAFIVLSSCMLGALICASGAYAASGVAGARGDLHACPNPQIANVLELEAGAAPHAYIKYGTNCAGAKSMAKAFVTSKCSRAASVISKLATKSKRCVLKSEFCTTSAVVSTTRRTADIACFPSLNPNALSLFEYHYPAPAARYQRRPA